MLTVLFVRAAGERAAKTVAQTLLSLFLVGRAFDVFTFAWGPALGIAAGAAVISVLTSIASYGASGTPSLGAAEQLPDPAAADPTQGRHEAL